MDHPLIAVFREHAVLAMLVLFVGVLYWAFRGRFKRRRDDGKSDDGSLR